MKFIHDNFDLLFDEAGSVNAFKRLILEMGVRGKLVPQDPNDEPASLLIEKIKKEKERLIKDGVLNKEKPLPPIMQAEVPFNLPDGWEWVRLGVICNYIQRGKSPIYSEIKMIPVVAQKCVQWSGFDISRAKFIDPNTLEKYSAERFLEPLDLLWNSTGVGTLGRINIYDGDKKYEKVVADSHVTVIRPAKSFIDSHFLFNWFSSPEVQNEINNKASGSTKQTELATSTIKDHIVPLPPLNEQNRIVQKVDEIFEMIPQLEEAFEKRTKYKRQLNQTSLYRLTDAKSRDDFVSSMQFITNNFDSLYDNIENVKELRQAILTLAVQGKLVPQDPNDEPASVLLERIQKEKERLIKEGVLNKEKPLPPIKQDEVPFELPEGWIWIYLDAIVKVSGGKRLPKGYSLTSKPTNHIYIRITDMKNGTIIDNDLRYIDEQVYCLIKNYIITKNDLYITIAGTIGQVGMVPSAFDNMNLTENAARLSILMVNKKWLYYFLCSSIIQNILIGKTNKMAQPKLALKRIRNTIFPLPPLNEQKRIVERIETLLVLCDDLESRSFKSNPIAKQLLNITLQEVLA